MEESHRRTNAKASFQGSGWIHIQHKKTRSLDYSRHLCSTTRSAALIDKRPSKSFSDTDAIEILKQRIARRQSDPAFNTTNMTLEGQSVTRTPQIQVYQKDKTFHRKYGSKSEETGFYTSSNSIAIHRSCSNSPTSSSCFSLNDDDCTRSFCDSVSSIACSNFTLENDDHEKWEKKLTFSDRFGNFNAIETWLQRSSTSVS